MKYKLVLWDFDGTLADTLTLALTVYNRLAVDKGFEPVTNPILVRDMGMREFLKAHRIGMHQVPFAFSAFLKELRKHTATVRLNAGIAATLTRISDGQIRQGVVSSNDEENIRRCLQANGVDACFSHISGTSRLMGKERSIRKALDGLNLNADACLYVGDEIRDIKAARKAGVDIAAVTWGLNSASALTSHSPDYLVDQPDDLADVLKLTAAT